MSSKLRFGILLLLVSLFLASNKSFKPLSSQEILNLVNADRESRGLQDLNLDPTLTLAAFAKAEDMVSKNYFGHVSPDGNYPWVWFKNLGYNYAYAGENLALGFDDAKELENSWMSSPSHRANILSPFYSDVGLAVINKGNSNLIVEFFGAQESKVTLRQ